MDLEKQVIDTVTLGLGDAIKARLAQGYGDSPLNRLVDAVVASRATEIRALIEEAVDGALVGDFRAVLREAVTHKLARVLTSKLEGEIEKRANELRASPEMRARITLAIEQAVKSAANAGAEGRREPLPTKPGA